MKSRGLIRVTFASLVLASTSPFYLDRGVGSVFAINRMRVVRFSAPLHTDRIGPGVWDVSGVTAPTWQWWCDDPTGASGETTFAATVTGSLDESDSPFCDANGACLKMCWFDGANDYVTATDASVGRINSADATICVLYATPGSGGDFVLGKKESGTGEGWGLNVKATDDLIYFRVENDAASENLAVFNDFVPIGGHFVLLCGTVDFDGDVVASGDANFDTGNKTTSPGGTVASTAALQIGARGDGNDRLSGYIVGAFGFPSKLSDADILTTHNALQAMAATKGSDITFDRNSTAWAEDADGQYQAFANDMAAQTEEGVSIHDAVTNYWEDSLDASAWADYRTPIVTTDTTSGPFSSYNGGAEADTIEDNDGANWEGKDGPDLIALGTGTYTLSCWFKEGTLADVKLAISTDGTGSNNCPQSLTSSFARYTCSATIGGAPTTIIPRFYVGAAGTDTGTIIVDACQVEKSDYAGRPCLAGGSAATCAADLATVVAPSSILDAGGALKEQTCFQVTGYQAARPEIGALWYLGDSAGVTTDYWYVFVNMDNAIYLRARSTEEGVTRVLWNTANAAFGDGKKVKTCISATPAHNRVWIDDVEVALTPGTAISSPPDNLDTLQLGGIYLGNSYPWNGELDNFEVSR